MVAGDAEIIAAGTKLGLEIQACQGAEATVAGPVIRIRRNTDEGTGGRIAAEGIQLGPGREGHPRGPEGQATGIPAGEARGAHGA